MQMLICGIRHKKLAHILIPIACIIIINCLILLQRRNHAFLKALRGGDSLDDDNEGLHLYVQDHREHEAHGVLHSPDRNAKIVRDGRFSYVTLMCDDSWLPQLRVLVYSWKRIKSPFPMVVLTLPWARESTMELQLMGATIKDVDYLEVPFKRKNGRKMSFEKACRYSKIHAWNLTEYERSVFLDPTMMIVQNIDELFHYSADFSGVKIVGDEFNTSLFVFKPNAEVYKRMLDSYQQSPPEHRGEQGFLNWFFSGHQTKVISARYNTVVRLKVFQVATIHQ